MGNVYRAEAVLMTTTYDYEDSAIVVNHRNYNALALDAVYTKGTSDALFRLRVDAYVKSTHSGQEPVPATVSIASVADAGGGDVLMTTSTSHILAVGDMIRVYGTNTYNAVYQVLTVPSATTFTVTATWAATSTGSLFKILEGWAQTTVPARNANPPTTGVVTNYAATYVYSHTGSTAGDVDRVQIVIPNVVGDWVRVLAQSDNAATTAPKLALTGRGICL